MLVAILCGRDEFQGCVEGRRSANLVAFCRALAGESQACDVAIVSRELGAFVRALIMVGICCRFA